MRIRSTAVMLATAFAFGSLADETARTAALEDDDAKFFEKSASAELLEVESGRLAARRATNREVVKFGQRMAIEHTQTSAELRALAARKKFTLATGMSDDDQERLAQLRKEKPGLDFEARFRSLMVDTHEHAVSLYEHTAKDGKDSDVRAFAAKRLPRLQQDEADAKALPKITRAPTPAPPAPVSPH